MQQVEEREESAAECRECLWTSTETYCQVYRGWGAGAAARGHL